MTHDADGRDDPREDSLLLGRRTFLIGNEALICADYRPRRYLLRFGIEDEAFVYCTSRSRLRASFTGERMHLDEFYRALEGIRPE